MAKQFYIIENNTDEDILHEYHQCNSCSAEPIWGLRFKCSVCDDCDLCESCFDARLLKINLKSDEQDQSNDQDNKEMKIEDIICELHSFQCIEVILLTHLYSYLYQQMVLQPITSTNVLVVIKGQLLVHALYALIATISVSVKTATSPDHSRI